MPSDQRLHPLSLLFQFGSLARFYALPGLVFLVTAGTVGWGWEIWLMPLLVPFMLGAVARYLSFRYRYEATEMVIRSGILFRNERHIPYARIQNLDGVQNVLHRALGVIEVRVQTGAGAEPEATMSVLPIAAYEEMRRRVFAERVPSEAVAESAAGPAEDGGLLLRLPPRELALCGFLDNRGGFLIAAAIGLVWQLGWLDRYTGSIFGEKVSPRSVVRALYRTLAGFGDLSLSRIALTLAAVAGFLLLIRVISMGWAVVRLHGFRLTLAGEDLRTEYGLLTRVSATIPKRRLQTLTILEGPLHRRLGRASVRVETAGGEGEGDEAGSKDREWLAPILHRRDLPGLLQQVLPGLDLAAVAWNPAHPRAFRRELKGSVIVAAGLTLALILLLEWWDLALLAVLLGWAYLHSRLYIAHLGWATTEGAILFRSGWIWRRITIVRFSKIQAVAIRESPFDRRAGMARVRVDTAGAGNASHRVDIPYLARETARELCDQLAAQAARTAFRW